MALIKREYTDGETLITAKNLNDIQDAIIMLEGGLFTIDSDAKGEAITLTDAANRGLRGLNIYGKTTQDGTPTPENPVELVSVGNSGSITVKVTGNNGAQSVTSATPNGLPGIPVSEGGNYTDASGQQWICDEIDFARGVYVQRVGCTDLAGANWSQTGSGRYYTARHSGVYSSAHRVLCTHITGGKVSNGNDKNVIFINANNDIRLNIDVDNGTVESVKTVMNGAILAGVLNAPIETPLSAEEREAYAALHTYRGNTTVSNDAGAYMDLEYVMDAKKYIDSLAGTGFVGNATVE